MMTLIYGFCSFLVFVFFFVMKIYQIFGKTTVFLFLLFADIFWCGFDCLTFFSFKGYKEIKEINEFIANCVKYLKFGEISLWVLIICLYMCLTYIKIGKICIDSKE